MKNKYRLALCLALSGAILAGTTKGGVISYDSSSIISYASQNKIIKSADGNFLSFTIRMNEDFVKNIKSVEVNGKVWESYHNGQITKSGYYYLSKGVDYQGYGIKFANKFKKDDKVVIKTSDKQLSFTMKGNSFNSFSDNILNDIVDMASVSFTNINAPSKPDPGQKQPDGQAGTEDASKYIKKIETSLGTTTIRMDDDFVKSIESIEVNEKKWKEKSGSGISDKGLYYLNKGDDADGCGVKFAKFAEGDRVVIKTKDKELSFTVNNPSDSASFIKKGSLKVKNISDKTQPDPSKKEDNPGASQGETPDEKEISFVYNSNPVRYNVLKLSKGKLDKSKVEKLIINGVVQTEVSSPSSVYGNDKYAFSRDGELCIQSLGNNHSLSITYDGKEYNYLYKDNKLVENKDKKEINYQIKLHGEFDSLLVGQKKIDGYTGGSVSVSNNPNSVSVKYTDKDSPKDEDWKKLDGKGSEFTDIKAVISDPESGIRPTFNYGSISLEGDVNKEGTFQIWLEATDVSRKKIISNKVDCHVYKEGKDKLEDLLITDNFRQTKDGKYMWDMRPWRVTKFSDSEEVIVPQGLKAWFGSHKKDVYGELGFETLEEPSQTLVVGEGANLTFKRMKIFGSVKIIVKDGGVLNLDDSVVFGKIEVSNGGKINVNYNPYNDKITDGASISGQIVLKDGAILGKSSIYSHTNWLGQGKHENTNDKPVIKVEGKVKIEDEVYIRGDHAATHSKHGQPALEVGPKGEVEIGENSSLYLYGGGMNHLTEVGGDALILNGGKITGKGKLVAVAGEGIEKNGGNGVSGKGTISVAKAYIRGGNGKNPGKALESDKIKFNGTKGTTIDGKVPTTKDPAVPEDYWHNTFRPLEKVINKINSALEENKDKPIKSSPADKKETTPVVPSGKEKPAGKQKTHSTYGTSQGGSTKDYGQKRDLKKYIDQLKEAMMENKIAIKSAKFLLENAPKQVAPVRDKLIKLVENANNIIEKSQNILKKLGEIED
ncbi:hypothetical protein [Anaerococcus lactolyticus]|uniref:Uncharacterized protein n=1 Tax=Anaerococcus lactolyticus S7-1-13 TaxID=1284686 RepID=A0A095YH29_9FIRM|nr:hypothetical protein [Anaerococcus lactolyticus]KGF05807.1 hypothetical protein HMPREF1630_00370 [Anaerococcus lactolyticus S7-1-13]